MKEHLLFISSTGTIHRWRDEADGAATIISTTEVAPVLELNQAMRLHNDGYSPSREMRRVASIPLALIEKWKLEEGWDAMDPACADKLAQKLMDPDYSALRTADGRVGLVNGELR